MDDFDRMVYEIEMNAWRELGAQRAKEREEAEERQGMKDYCKDCGQVEWFCICKNEREGK
jgi:DTW domain-containing protein YfiP